jgi:polar amino acid transport system substrate-binding protein
MRRELAAGLALLMGLLLLGSTVAPVRADILATIRQRGELINGVEAQNPPFEYIDQGKIVGYDVDVTNAIAKALGVKARIVDTAWSGIIPALYSKKFDVILSAMTVTDERMKQVNFSTPLASDQFIVFSRADDQRFKNFSDLAGATVGTQLNSASEQYLKAYATKHDVKFKELKLYDHYDEAFIDMKNKNIDAAVTGIITGQLNFLKKFPGQYQIAVRLPIYLYMSAAIRKEDADLLKSVNDAIAAMKKSGELDALQMKWFGFKMHLPDQPRAPEIAE